jgi:hypothetical protein
MRTVAPGTATPREVCTEPLRVTLAGASCAGGEAASAVAVGAASCAAAGMAYAPQFARAMASAKAADVKALSNFIWFLDIVSYLQLLLNLIGFS